MINIISCSIWNAAVNVPAVQEALVHHLDEDAAVSAGRQCDQMYTSKVYF